MAVPRTLAAAVEPCYLPPAMGQPQHKLPDLVTLAEFFAMSFPDDLRRELHDGQVVAMAPPASAHGTLVGNLLFAIRVALRGRPCRVIPEAGVIPPGRDHTYYQADLVLTCEPHRLGDRDHRVPLLIAEVLSPSTTRLDLQRKLPDYREIPSVREILLVDSERMRVELHRRVDATGWLSESLRGPAAVVQLVTADLRLALADLYEGVDVLPDDDPAR